MVEVKDSELLGWRGGEGRRRRLVVVKYSELLDCEEGVKEEMMTKKKATWSMSKMGRWVGGGEGAEKEKPPAESHKHLVEVADGELPGWEEFKSGDPLGLI